MPSTFFDIQWPELLPFKDEIYVISDRRCMFDAVGNVVEDINSAKAAGKTKLIFNCPDETLRPSALKKAHLIVDRIDTLAGNIFYITGHSDGPSAYYSWALKTGQRNRMTILTSLAQILQFRDSARSISMPEPMYDIKIKDKKFVCFNKVHRGHRVYILAKMLENGLVDQSYFSFEGAWPNWINELERYDWAPVIDAQLSKNIDRFPMRLNITEDRTNPVQMDHDDIRFHTNSYFSLVTETIFHKHLGPERGSNYECVDGIFFTEKIGRPLLLKHPFILAGAEYSLRRLRQLGFKTFHPFIDESYDIEVNDDKRLDMIIAETERLCKFTDDQWLEWQQNIKEIVEHNYTHLMSMPKYSVMTNVAELFKINR